MKRLFFCTAFIGFLLLCGSTSAQEHKLIKLWETDTLLKIPESVRYDARNKVLYTANIDGQAWEMDGKGSIGKVGLDGKIIASEWVTGLNAPKGMDIFSGKLFVADVDAVAVIDISQGKIIQRITVEGAQGLNDLSIDAKGAIFVSDSRTKKIHRIENGRSTVVVDNLSGPNGVLVVGSDLYLTNSGGLYKHEKTGALTLLADGMEGGTDGIEAVGNGDFIVSCWAGSVWYVYANGKKEHLLDTREQKINSADIGYDPVNKTVYIPTFFKNNVVAYSLK